MPERHTFATEAALTEFGASFVRTLGIGNVVLLSGPLGAGKTTLARAMLRGLGWKKAVRSPTYNLIQVYATTPSVMHADLYRLESAACLGLEEYFDSHLCFIEWPDRLHEVLDGCEDVVEIDIGFAGEGRVVTVSRRGAR
jgi:tRNA threonylcarbamoyl adenosine modification protein YjeE